MTRFTSTSDTTVTSPTVTFKEQMSKFHVTPPSCDAVWSRTEPPAEYTLDATSYLSKQVMSPVTRYKDLTFYKLEIDKTQLFPDFYYQFLRNFAKVSSANNAYCERNMKDFMKVFIGPENDVRQAVSTVAKEFSDAFKMNLGSSLKKAYELTYCDRTFVESTFVQEMIDKKDWIAYGVRLNTVVGKAISGEVKPYVCFFKAYNVSDENIWMQIFPLLMKRCTSKADMETFRKKLKAFKEKEGTLLNNLKDFIECLESKKLFFRKVPKAQQGLVSTINGGESRKAKKPGQSKRVFKAENKNAQKYQIVSLNG